MRMSVGGYYEKLYEICCKPQKENPFQNFEIHGIIRIIDI